MDCQLDVYCYSGRSIVETVDVTFSMSGPAGALFSSASVVPKELNFGWIHDTNIVGNGEERL